LIQITVMPRSGVGRLGELFPSCGALTCVPFSLRASKGFGIPKTNPAGAEESPAGFKETGFLLIIIRASYAS